MLYANFTDSSTNYGNHVIEYATQSFLKDYFKDNFKVDFDHFDSFSDTIPTSKHSKLLIPGCTMLTPGQNKALDHIDSSNYKAYCLAGSLWYPQKSKDFILRTRIISFGKNPTPNLNIVNSLSGIIGSRDRFTYEMLKKNNINTLYAGCPTLFLKPDNINNDGDYVLFSFGRANFHKQVYYASKLAENHKVIGIVHEKGRKEMVKAAGWKFPVITYNGDIELYLSYFKNATYVVSGRLHGALPALAYNKKTFYFGTDDTRLSILDDLGIKIHKYSEIPDFEKKSTRIENPEILNYFKSNMTAVADSIFKD